MQNKPDDSWGFLGSMIITMYPRITYELVHRNKKPRIKQIIKACKISKNDFVNLKDGWQMNVALLDKKSIINREMIMTSVIK